MNPDDWEVRDAEKVCSEEPSLEGLSVQFLSLYDGNSLEPSPRQHSCWGGEEGLQQRGTAGASRGYHSVQSLPLHCGPGRGLS